MRITTQPIGDSIFTVSEGFSKEKEDIYVREIR